MGSPEGGGEYGLCCCGACWASGLVKVKPGIPLGGAVGGAWVTSFMGFGDDGVNVGNADGGVMPAGTEAGLVTASGLVRAKGGMAWGPGATGWGTGLRTGVGAGCPIMCAMNRCSSGCTGAAGWAAMGATVTGFITGCTAAG